MTYVAKLLDPAGRFCCSRGFNSEFKAARQACRWSLYGATSYVMNGSIRAIYRNGVRRNFEQTKI